MASLVPAPPHRREGSGTELRAEVDPRSNVATGVDEGKNAAYPW